VERADVARRTFSRRLSGKEDAALDFVRDDGDRINALLRGDRRPSRHRLRSGGPYGCGSPNRRTRPTVRARACGTC